MGAVPALEGTFVLEATRLRVTYVVRNASNTEVGLFNVLPELQPDGTVVLRAGAVNVDLEDGTLHLRKMVLPVPEGLRMAERPIPYVTRVPPGGVFTEEISIPVPVEVDSPFRRALLAASAPDDAEVLPSAPAQATAVTLSIGAFAAEPSWKFIAVAPEYPDVYRVWPPGPPADAQQILTLTWRDVPPVPVLDYEVVSWAR